MRLALAAWLAFSASMWAQVPTKFSVASVRPGSGDRFNVMNSTPGGNFTATGVVVKLLIMQAYSVSEAQIVDAPDWTEKDHFDIRAQAEGLEKQLTAAEANPMLRALLEDRFGLKVHREMQRRPIFGLVQLPSGSKLKPAADLPAGATGGLRGSVGFGSFTGVHVPLMRLTQMLSTALGRPIVDQTGLTGDFDFQVAFDKNSVPDPGLPGLRRSPPEVAPEPNGPSLFTALQEQLGLKLETQTGPVEVLVIDHVAQPSEN